MRSLGEAYSSCVPILRQLERLLWRLRDKLTAYLGLAGSTDLLNSLGIVSKLDRNLRETATQVPRQTYKVAHEFPRTELCGGDVVAVHYVL